MRTPDEGMDRLREATGARPDDPNLIGVQLDLIDAASIAAAREDDRRDVGAPHALVHNAGISAAGMARENADKPVGEDVSGPPCLARLR